MAPTTSLSELRQSRSRLGWSQDITAHTLGHSFASLIYAHLHDERKVKAVGMM
jgi:integrase